MSDSNGQQLFGVAIFHAAGDVIGSTSIAKQLKATHPDSHVVYITSRKYGFVLDGCPHIDEIVLLDGDPFALDQSLENLRAMNNWTGFYTPAPYMNYHRVQGGDLAELTRASYDGEWTIPHIPSLCLQDSEIEEARSFVRDVPDGKRILVETEFFSQQSPWNDRYLTELLRELSPLGCQFIFTAKDKPAFFDSIATDYPNCHWANISLRANAELFNLCSAFVGVSSGVSCVIATDYTRHDIPCIEVVKGRHWSTYHIQHGSKKMFALTFSAFQDRLKILKHELSTPTQTASCTTFDRSLGNFFLESSNGHVTTFVDSMIPPVTTSDLHLVRAFAELLAELPPFYFHAGGIGDALTLMSSMSPEQRVTIVSNAHSRDSLSQFFGLFTNIDHVYFVDGRVADSSETTLKLTMQNSGKLLGSGTTSLDPQAGDWNAELDIVAEFGVDLHPAWAQGFKDGKKLKNLQVVLAPQGSLKGMFRSKRNVLNPRWWNSIIELLNANGITPIVLGVPAQRISYPTFGDVVDKRDSSLEEQMRIVANADLIIGADTWHKTMGALCGVPCIVADSLTNVDLAFIKDTSHFVFIHPWKELKLVGTFEQLESETIELMKEVLGIHSPVIPCYSPRVADMALPKVNRGAHSSFDAHFWKRDYNSAKQVLVRCTDAVGDALMTTCIVREMKEQFPHLSIVVSGNTVVRDVFKNNSRLSSVIEINSEIELFEESRSDVVVDFRSMADLLIDYYGGTHFMHILGNVAGISLRSLELDYDVSTAEHEESQCLLRNLNVESDAELIGVHVFSSKDPNRTYVHTRELLKTLLERYPDSRVVLFGTAPHAIRDPRLIDLARLQLDLRQQIAVASQCTSFISTDSSFYHVAQNLFAIPTLLLASVTEPFLIGNPSKRNVVVARSTASGCKACYWNCKGARSQNPNDWCFASLTVTEVLSKFEALRAGAFDDLKYVDEMTVDTSTDPNYLDLAFVEIRKSLLPTLITVRETETPLPEHLRLANGIVVLERDGTTYDNRIKSDSKQKSLRSLPSTVDGSVESKGKQIGVALFHAAGDVVASTAVVRQMRVHFPDAHIVFFTSTKYAGLLAGNPTIDELVVCDGDPFELDRIIDQLRLSRSWFKFLTPAPYMNPDPDKILTLTQLMKSSVDVEWTIPFVPFVPVTVEDMRSAEQVIEGIPEGPRILVETEYLSEQSWWTDQYVEMMIDKLKHLSPVFLFTSKVKPLFMGSAQSKYPHCFWVDIPLQSNIPLANLCSAFIGVSSGVSCVVNSELTRRDLPCIEVVRGLHWSTSEIEHFTQKVFAFSQSSFESRLDWLESVLTSENRPVHKPTCEKSRIELLVDSYQKKTVGKFTYLDGFAFPDWQSLNFFEFKDAIDTLRQLPPFYFHCGGVGDALLLLSSVMESDKPITVLSIPNNLETMESFFSTFPQIERVIFLDTERDFGKATASRLMISKLDNCLSMGVTPAGNFAEEWTNGVDIESRFGSKKNPLWAESFTKKRVVDRKQVVIAPKGDSLGVDLSKRNIIDPNEWDFLLEQLLAEGVQPVILGTPEESLAYPSMDSCLDCRSKDFREQMSIIAGADVVIAADSWHKTWSAMCGIPTYVVTSQRNARQNSLQDLSEHVFLDGWNKLTALRSVQELFPAVTVQSPKLLRLRQKLTSNSFHERESTSFSSWFHTQQPWNDCKSALIRLGDDPAENLIITAIVQQIKMLNPAVDISVSGTREGLIFFESSSLVHETFLRGSIEDLHCERSVDRTVDIHDLVKQCADSYKGIPLIDTLANIAGIKIESDKPLYRSTESERAIAKELLQREGFEDGMKLVVISTQIATKTGMSYPFINRLIEDLQKAGDNIFVVAVSSFNLRSFSSRVLNCDQKYVPQRIRHAFIELSDVVVTVDDVFFQSAHRIFNKPTILIATQTHPQLSGLSSSTPLSVIRNSFRDCNACYSCEGSCESSLLLEGQCRSGILPSDIASEALRFINGEFCADDYHTKKPNLNCDFEWSSDLDFVQLFKHLRTLPELYSIRVVEGEKPLPPYCESWNGIALIRKSDSVERSSPLRLDSIGIRQMTIDGSDRVTSSGDAPLSKRTRAMLSAIKAVDSELE